MKVRILTTVAWGKRMVVIDFGNVVVSVDEGGTVARYLDGKPEVVTKWEEAGPEIKLFVPREEEAEGFRKRIINGELVIENLNNAKVGRVVEVEFPEYRIFERAST
jgi:hypothetical protein